MRRYLLILAAVAAVGAAASIACLPAFADQLEASTSDLLQGCGCTYPAVPSIPSNP